MGSEDAKTTVELTAELTDIYTKEDYPKFNRRVSKDREQPEQAGERKPLNMQTYVDISRHDKSFGPVFLREVRSQLKTMNQGDPKLYNKPLKQLKNA